MKTVNGTKVINTDIDRNQAQVLLEDAYNKIVERVNQLRDALDKVTHFNPKLLTSGRYSEFAERYDSARERAYAAIARLDDMAEELFPLFEEE